jgi:hypothetical protein
MRRFLTALAVLALTGCVSDYVRIPTTGSGGTSSGGTGISGSYTLQAVDGFPLPYTYSQTGADKKEIVTDVIVLTDAGTWSEVVQQRQTVAGVTTNNTLTQNGTYTRSGTSGVYFVTSDNDTFSGLVSGNTMTLYGPSPSGQTVPQLFTK